MKLTTKLTVAIPVLLFMLSMPSCSNASSVTESKAQTEENTGSAETENTPSDNGSTNENTAKAIFEQTVQVTPAQAADKIKTASQNTLIVLTAAFTENDISAMREALFTLAQNQPSVRIGIDFSGEIPSTGRSAVQASRAAQTSNSLPRDAFYDNENGRGGVPNLAYTKLAGETKDIGKRAFKGCTALETIDLPSTMTDIGADVFEECSALTEVIIPEGVTTIKDSTFKGCTSLTSVTIPSSVTAIADEAFYNCDRLASIKLPESLESIGTKSFLGCQSLKSVAIPGSVTSVGANAFDGTSLTTVRIAAGAGGIDSSAFADCGTFELIITRNGDKAITSGLCKGWTNIKSVEILSGITEVGEYAFYQCTGLKSVEFASSITDIADYAFYECTSLTSVDLPQQLLNIGDMAFGRTSLKSLVIPDSVQTLAHRSFYCIKTLESLKLGSGIKTLDGFVGAGLKSLVIPNTVTSIAYRCFEGSELESVTIPGSVEVIGAEAFSLSSPLSSITIENGVRVIGAKAFTGCNLTDVTVPESVTTILLSAFANRLERLTLAKPDNWYRYELKSNIEMGSSAKYAQNLENYNKTEGDPVSFSASAEENAAYYNKNGLTAFVQEDE